MDSSKLEKFVSVLGWLSVLVIWALVSASSLVLSVLFTNPVGVGPAGVTVWFLISFMSFASIAALAFYTAKTFLHVHATGAQRLRYSWRQGLLVSGWGRWKIAGS